MQATELRCVECQVPLAILEFEGDPGTLLCEECAPRSPMASRAAQDQAFIDLTEDDAGRRSDGRRGSERKHLSDFIRANQG